MHKIKDAKVAIWDWSGTIVRAGDILSEDSKFWLEWLHSHNVPQGVISNETDDKYLMKSIRKHDLSRYFGENSYVICSGSTYAPKPATDMFEVLMRRMKNTDESGLIYIGDSDTDHQFARNCGCVFVHVKELSDR